MEVMERPLFVARHLPFSPPPPSPAPHPQRMQALTSPHAATLGRPMASRRAPPRGGLGGAAPLRASAAGRCGAPPPPPLAARPRSLSSTLALPARRSSRPTSLLVVAASRDSDPSPLERAAAAGPYLIPLVDALGRGRFLFTQFPAFFGLLLTPVRPLAQLYYGLPFASLAVFFAVYLGIVQNASLPRFARLHAMQAILLDILLVLPSLLERVFGGAPRGGPGLDLYMSASSTIFLFVLACFFYGAGSALVGKAARLPLVADAAEAQTRF